MMSHYFISGWQSVRKFKSRSALALLTIIVSAVILSLGFSLEKGLEEQSQAVGDLAPDTYSVRAEDFQGIRYESQPIPFSAVATLDKDTRINAISYGFTYDTRLSRSGDQFEVSALVTNSSYARLRGLATSSGEFAIISSDTDNSVVIGHQLAERIFGPEGSGVGNKLDHNGVKLTVVGILEPVDSLAQGLNGDINHSILIGRSTYEDTSGSPLSHVDQAIFTLRNDVTAETVLTSVQRDLDQTLPSHTPVVVESFADSLDIDQDIINYNRIVQAGAALSLFISAASIANVMLAIAASRIREIGVRKSVGASSGDIFWQHIIEPAQIGFIAAFLSVAITVGIVLVGSSYYSLPLSIEYWSLAGISLLVLVLPTLFGLYPAILAAKTATNQALRYE